MRSPSHFTAQQIHDHFTALKALRRLNAELRLGIPDEKLKEIAVNVIAGGAYDLR